MNTFSFSIEKKILLWNTCLIILSGIFIGTLFLKETKEILINQELSRMKEDTLLFKGQLHNKIATLKEDVLLLSKTPPIEGIIRAQRNGGVDNTDQSTELEWKKRLTHIFQQFLQFKPYYLSIRYIGGNEGKEIVRVDSRKGTAIVTYEDKLQIKLNTHYYKEAIKLNERQVHLSSFSLNREYGKISTPYTPTLRAATPIIDDQGNTFGIIIINYDASRLLNSPLGSHLPLQITNHNGYFLNHPNPLKTFGFDKQTEWTIQLEKPYTAELFKANNTIQKQAYYLEDESITLVSKIYYDAINPHHFLAVSVSANKYHLSETIDKSIYKYIFYISSIIIVLIGLTFFFSRWLTKPLLLLISTVSNSSSKSSSIIYPENSHDEIGFLGKTLNEMNKTINERSASLSKSEQSIRMIVESVPDGIITIDPKGTVCSFNSSAELLFGYFAKEVIGKNINMLMPEPHHSQHDSYLTNFLSSGNAKIIGSSVEVTALRKDGSLFPMELRVGKMDLPRQDEGMGLYFIGVCRDIEAFKNKEFQLQQLHEQNQIILDNAGEGIFRIDATGKITYSNPQACSLLGYNAEELKNQNLHLIAQHTKADGSHLYAKDGLIQKTLTTEKPIYDNNSIFWTKSETSFPIEFSSVPLVTDSSIKGAVITFKDISQRKHAETALLKEKEKAEKASQEKTAFLSRMSHELRTPLNSIIGFANYLKEEKLTEVQLDSLSEIETSGNHLLTIVDEMITLSTINSEQTFTVIHPVDINSVIDNCMPKLQEIAKTKQLHISNQLNKTDNINLFIDTLKFEKVLSTFFIKVISLYVQPKSTIILSFLPIVNNHIRIQIEDRNHFLNAKQLKHFFDPFQIDKPNAKETNIDLLIAQELMRSMQGEIGVDVITEKGTCYWIDVKATDKE